MDFRCFPATLRDMLPTGLKRLLFPAEASPNMLLIPAVFAVPAGTGIKRREFKAHMVMRD